MIKQKATNQEMQEVCNHSGDYQPIDYNGYCQSKVDNNTAYIVDCSNEGNKDTDLLIIVDREDGKSGGHTAVRKWW